MLKPYQAFNAIKHEQVLTKKVFYRALKLYAKSEISFRFHLYGKFYLAWRDEARASKGLKALVTQFFKICIQRLRLTPQACMAFFNVRRASPQWMGALLFATVFCNFAPLSRHHHHYYFPFIMLLFSSLFSFPSLSLFFLLFLPLLTPESMLACLTTQPGEWSAAIAKDDMLKIRRLMLEKLFVGWRAETRDLRITRYKASQILARMVRRTKGPLWVKEATLVCFHMWYRYIKVKVRGSAVAVVVAVA
jgi:hypothetical protein